MLTAAWFLPWLFAHTDTSKPWVSVPFLAATLTVVAAALLSVVNRWQRAVPVRSPVPAGQEPSVAVIIPTLGEPLELLEATVRSVLEQDWPEERLWIVVSDDGHDERVQALVAGSPWPIAGRPCVTTARHDRVTRAAVERRRPATSIRHSHAFRAASGSSRHATLMTSSATAASCARALASCSPLTGSPSYRRARPARSPSTTRSTTTSRTSSSARCSRATPPTPCSRAARECCGGARALHEIGDFPTWNLVEDLHSGLEALRRGWEGCYLPIVGAYAQHSPEDLPNFVKQRGTWALDTVRLALWAPKRGLTMRQRLQFYELAIFYLQGPATLVFLLAPVLGFVFHLYPVVTTTNAFVLHFWPFVVALELYLVLVHRPMSLEQLWRARLVWAGLCFVYARACLLAVGNGRTRKPRYVVTRKHNRHVWHWRLIVPHVAVLTLLIGSMAWSLAHRGLLNSFDIGSAYWACLYSLLLLSFIKLSWHGANLDCRACARAAARAERMRRPRPPGVVAGALCPHRSWRHSWRRPRRRRTPRHRIAALAIGGCRRDPLVRARRVLSAAAPRAQRQQPQHKRERQGDRQDRRALAERAFDEVTWRSLLARVRPTQRGWTRRIEASVVRSGACDAQRVLALEIRRSLPGCGRRDPAPPVLRAGSRARSADAALPARLPAAVARAPAAAAPAAADEHVHASSRRRQRREQRTGRPGSGARPWREDLHAASVQHAADGTGDQRRRHGMQARTLATPQPRRPGIPTERAGFEPAMECSTPYSLSRRVPSSHSATSPEPEA